MCQCSGLDYYHRRYHCHVNKRSQYWDWSSSEGISGTGNTASPWQRQLAVAETGGCSELHTYIEWNFGRFQRAVNLEINLMQFEMSVLFCDCYDILECSILRKRWRATSIMEKFEMLVIQYYNTRSTQKSLVRQQNTWFDTKKSGSTQKCPVRHKNALPSMPQLTLPLSNIPPSCEKCFFPISF